MLEVALINMQNLSSFLALKGFQYQKCAQYWPPSDDGFVRFGNIEIETTEKVIITQLQNTERRLLSIRGQYKIQVIRITQVVHEIDVKSFPDVRRDFSASTVNHFQFPEWPDFGAASSSNIIINLIKTIQMFVSKGQG